MSLEEVRVGSLIAGKYEVVRQLGKGGFGKVFEARHRVLGHRVAIKILMSLQAAHSYDRFLREARIAAQLQDPNIVGIHDFGRLPSKHPFMVMEMLDGHDLSRELTVSGPMKEARALALFCRCLGGLAKAHAQGIVHKDLKPSNLFLMFPGTPSEVLRILDFGIARVLDADALAEARAANEDENLRLTATGKAIGTPQYLAPEYIESQIVTPALDVYQMGLILVEVFMGAPVVKAPTWWACAMEHINGDFKKKIPIGLQSGALWPVIERALEKDPSRRFKDAEQMREALQRVLDARRSKAPQPPLAGFARKAREPTAKPFPELTQSQRNRIRSEYPFPIATVFAKALKRRNESTSAFDLTRHLQSLYEVTLRCVAAVAASQYRRETTTRGVESQRIEARLAALGQTPDNTRWLDLLRAVLEEGWKAESTEGLEALKRVLLKTFEGGDEVVALYHELCELSGPSGQRRRAVGWLDLLEGLGAYRDTISQTANLHANEYIRHNRVLMEILSRFLVEADCLAGFVMGHVKKVLAKARHNYEVHVNLCKGNEFEYDPDYSFATDRFMESGHLYLFLEAREDLVPVLDLHPLVVMDYCPKDQQDQLFFFNGMSPEGCLGLSYRCGHQAAFSRLAKDARLWLDLEGWRAEGWVYDRPKAQADEAPFIAMVESLHGAMGDDESFESFRSRLMQIATAMKVPTSRAQEIIEGFIASQPSPEPEAPQVEAPSQAPTRATVVPEPSTRRAKAPQPSGLEARSCALLPASPDLLVPVQRSAGVLAVVEGHTIFRVGQQGALELPHLPTRIRTVAGFGDEALLVGCWDGALHALEQSRRVWTQHFDGLISAIAPMPDGSEWAVGSWAGELTLLDFKGHKLWSHRVGEGIHRLVPSPSGDRLLALDLAGVVSVYDTEGALLWGTSPEGLALSVCWGSEGELALVVGQGLHHFDPEGRKVGMVEFTEEVVACAPARDGFHVVTRDGAVRVVQVAGDDKAAQTRDASFFGSMGLCSLGPARTLAFVEPEGEDAALVWIAGLEKGELRSVRVQAHIEALEWADQDASLWLCTSEGELHVIHAPEIYGGLDAPDLSIQVEAPAMQEGVYRMLAFAIHNKGERPARRVSLDLEGDFKAGGLPMALGDVSGGGSCRCEVALRPTSVGSVPLTIKVDFVDEVEGQSELQKVVHIQVER